MKATVKLQQEGRIAIPYPVREKLNLQHGDIVELDIRPVEEGS